MRGVEPQPPAGFRGDFHSSEAERAAYAGASGILRSAPAAAAIPADAEDVQALVRWAADTRTSLVPRAAGTGMPGGNIGPGVAVDMMRGLRRIGPLEQAAGTIFTQPGATLHELNAACAPEALFFPVDPSSGARCSIGGMLANNSAGSHSVRYGATRQWVQALEVVLADGERVWFERGRAVEHPVARALLERVDAEISPHRDGIEAAWPRVRKNSSGYALREYLETGDTVDLIVGSEGTLALIVGATLRLAPVPAYRGLALIEFTGLDAAGEAILQLLPERPATCEMLDRTFLEIVRQGGGDQSYPLRLGLEAVLLVEMEGGSLEEVEEGLRRVERAVEGRAATVSLALEPDRQARFWDIRHAASPIIAARAGQRVSMQFIEDGVVPVENLPRYVRALREILERNGLPAVIFGHAGDGNLHVNPLVDVGAAGWERTLERVLEEVADAVRALGGTLSGEHGDGRLRAPLLERVWGADLVARFRAVKDAFDPLGILNPGVILPLPGQRPFDALRTYA